MHEFFLTGTRRAVLGGVSSSLSRRMPVGVLAGVGVAVMMACTTDDHEEDDTQFRQDVIWCEEAVAHLEDCCGATFDARQIECRHYYEKDTGCGQTSITRIDPAYTTTETQCIRDQSCEAIRGSQICERALAAGKARTARYESNNASSSTTSGSLSTSGLTSSSSTSGVVTSSTSTTSGSANSGPICP
ncbi:MAG: hypothetical protein U0270_37610 [Labilithrix sp.]